MPELPEVETVLRTLEHQIKGDQIIDVEIIYPRIVQMDLNDFSKTLKNKHFIDFKRRGKYLLFELEDCTLVSHLRMEGKYFIKDHSDSIDKHTHVVFYLKSGRKLCYQDVRKFGRMEIIDKNETYDDIYGLGLEPFDERLNLEYCKNYLRKKKVPLKQVLLDQSFIAGIGNIYANEILFAIKVHPSEPCNRLSEAKILLLIEKTRVILKEAIEAGGTTIRSYTSSLGVTGRFQQSLFVHNQEVCKCCGHLIEKIFISQRGTYFCPNCQKKRKSIGITGTIGSGKSTVSKIIREHGYYVFDADQEVYNLQQKGQAGYLKMLEIYPDFFEEGVLNRQKLADLIFNHPQEKKKLEALLHPLVLERLLEEMDQHSLFFAEIPLLFEAHFDEYFDETVTVYTNQKETLKRLKKRGLSLKDAKARIQSQMSAKEKIERATSVIYNNGTLEELESAVLEWLKKC